MAFTCEHMVEIEDAQKMERDLADVTKQRDALAEALEELERTAGQSTLWDDPARHNARKALAAVKGWSHE
jgi:light-regulated signal transduction histidine kinase (bacteriophytochrome)